MVVVLGVGASVLARYEMPLFVVLCTSLGAAVTQHAVFEEHARRYEAEFVEDMHSLNVKLPDALTRVTEYVPEIVSSSRRASRTVLPMKIAGRYISIQKHSSRRATIMGSCVPRTWATKG